MHQNFGQRPCYVLALIQRVQKISEEKQADTKVTCGDQSSQLTVPVLTNDHLPGKIFCRSRHSWQVAHLLHGL